MYLVPLFDANESTIGTKVSPLLVSSKDYLRVSSSRTYDGRHVAAAVR